MSVNGIGTCGAIAGKSAVYPEKNGENVVVGRKNVFIIQAPKQKEKHSVPKAIGTGAMSFCLPGLGQAFNNQWWKALGFFAASAIPFAVSTAMLCKGKIPSWKTITALHFGVHGLAAADAAINAKTKVEV